MESINEAIKQGINDGYDKESYDKDKQITYKELQDNIKDFFDHGINTNEASKDDASIDDILKEISEATSKTKKKRKK